MIPTVNHNADCGGSVITLQVFHENGDKKFRAKCKNCDGEKALTLQQVNGWISPLKSTDLVVEVFDNLC